MLRDHLAVSELRNTGRDRRELNRVRGAERAVGVDNQLIRLAGVQFERNLRVDLGPKLT